MARTPEFTLDLSSSYQFALASGTATISASYYHNSGFLWIAGDPVGQNAYDTVSGRVSWTTPNEKVTVSLWGRNLTNKFYYQTTSFSTAGFVGSPAQPREIGVGASVKF